MDAAFRDRVSVLIRNLVKLEAKPQSDHAKRLRIAAKLNTILIEHFVAVLKKSNKATRIVRLTSLFPRNPVGRRIAALAALRLASCTETYALGARSLLRLFSYTTASDVYLVLINPTLVERALRKKPTTK